MDWFAYWACRRPLVHTTCLGSSIADTFEADVLQHMLDRFAFHALRNRSFSRHPSDLANTAGPPSGPLILHVARSPALRRRQALGAARRARGETRIAVFRQSDRGQYLAIVDQVLPEPIMERLTGVISTVIQPDSLFAPM